MPVLSAVAERLTAIPNLTVIAKSPLSAYTRFRIGGPAAVLCDTSDAQEFAQALQLVQALAVPRMVIGGGTNLIVADTGFDGVVLRFTGAKIVRNGFNLTIESGAVLQDVVDRSVELGLKGMETLTGIPGYLGGAVYGNAGAYGHSMQELVQRVWFTDGSRVEEFNNSECQFHYRESIFKEQKDWVVLSTELKFHEGNTAELAKIAADIRTIRDAKYPPSMKCAGSIFKNIFFAELPPAVQSQVPANVVREGKVPSAWFLEQVQAKGMRRGDIKVADYHANLIYNDGNGTAADLIVIIEELKRRVREHFGFELEEEVQFVGFEYSAEPAL
ncbi:MAG TPA: UDP-N-acetylmuramate dehydrogenase [Bryobacteraceae bacterium]|nr:UDP-N-acetylmuramate dehydrogenase [Bryobacteraceae bacterium]